MCNYFLQLHMNVYTITSKCKFIFKKADEGNFFVKLLKMDKMELLTFDIQLFRIILKHFDGIFLNISCSWLVGQLVTSFINSTLRKTSQPKSILELITKIKRTTFNGIFKSHTNNG